MAFTNRNEEILTTLRGGLGAFLIDPATNIPLVPLERIVDIDQNLLPQHPFIVFNYPLYERPSGVGFNPPVPRSITPLKGDKIANGVVSETNVCGDWLVDLSKDFSNLGTKIVAGLGSVTIRAGKTQTVVNTTTGKTSLVKEVFDNHTLQLTDAHTFDTPLQSYELYETNGTVLFLREQRVGLRLTVVDRNKPGYDATKNVHLITQRILEYFDDQANEDLHHKQAIIAPNGVGSWVRNDQAFQQQGGQVMERRADMDVALIVEFESTLVKPDVEDQVFVFV